MHSRCFVLYCLLLTLPSARAENPAVSLREGDVVPSFSARDDQGKLWRSEDHVGRNVIVVYFFPADMTAGCTRQACSFRDRREELQSSGIEVVGVSGDSVKNHQLFKKAHNLNFPLLADVDGRVARAFGVPVRDGGEITCLVEGKQKKLQRGVTARRWTFVIGTDGTILDRNVDVEPETQGKYVLNVIRQSTVSTQ